MIVMEAGITTASGSARCSSACVTAGTMPEVSRPSSSRPQQTTRLHTVGTEEEEEETSCWGSEEGVEEARVRSQGRLQMTRKEAGSAPLWRRSSLQAEAR